MRDNIILETVLSTRSAGVNNPQKYVGESSNWTPSLEWYKAGLAFKNRQKDRKYMRYIEIGLRCSKDTILVAIAQHN